MGYKLSLQNHRYTIDLLEDLKKWDRSVGRSRSVNAFSDNPADERETMKR